MGSSQEFHLPKEIVHGLLALVIAMSSMTTSASAEEVSKVENQKVEASEPPKVEAVEPPKPTDALKPVQASFPTFEFKFPPPPPPLDLPARPEYYLAEDAPNCSYFLRAPGDRPTIKSVTRNVTYILVHKSGRRMVLFSGDQVLKEYKISLGFNPRGHKEFEGDGRTPEGKYYIEYKNPNSEYNLSLKISYPNAQDKARARARNQSPGDAIMIHGWPASERQRKLVTQIHRMDPRRAYPDKWTAGCIAVLDPEIEEMYPRIQVRTPIEICP